MFPENVCEFQDKVSLKRYYVFVEFTSQQTFFHFRYKKALQKSNELTHD